MIAHFLLIPQRRLRRYGAALRCLLATAAVVTTSPALAQSSGDGFLFKPPSGTVTFRTGFDRATAGSDVFTFAVKQLTLTDRDFSALTLAGDVGVLLTPRFEVVFGVSSSRSNAPSEFRDWVDNNRLPIKQTTTFERVPVTASVRAYLRQPGQTIGHFAWIPTRYAPYVGGGGGAMWYRFQQAGDFIDFSTTRVFPDRFDSSGWTPTAQGFVGTDVSLNPRFAVTAELRYQWASATLSRDFSGFKPIDLSGLSMTAGVSIRY